MLRKFSKMIKCLKELYTVALPFKHNPEILPIDYHITRGQLASLYSKFVKNGSLPYEVKVIYNGNAERDCSEMVGHDLSNGH